MAWRDAWMGRFLYDHLLNFFNSSVQFFISIFLCSLAVSLWIALTSCAISHYLNYSSLYKFHSLSTFLLSLQAKPKVTIWDLDYQNYFQDARYGCQVGVYLCELFLGWLWYNLAIAMENQQNQESFHFYDFAYGAMHDADDEDELQSPLFRQALLQSVNCFAAAEKNSTFSKQIDFLAAQSFHTEHRGSLQIVPDAPQHDFCSKPEEEIASTLKSSHSSLIFEDQQDEEEREAKLIIKTEALTIHSSYSDVAQKFNDFSPKKSSSPTKNHKQKNQPIRQSRQLIRELKRQYKYNHQILADVTLMFEEKTVNIKSGVIQPIVSQKGQLSGLIIRNGDLEHKIKVMNLGSGPFDPTLQLWDETNQEWNQVTFKFKIFSD